MTPERLAQLRFIIDSLGSVHVGTHQTELMYGPPLAVVRTTFDELLDEIERLTIERDELQRREDHSDHWLGADA